jgi:5-formyltetrahydrofolate cyclo-ligase
VRLRCAYAACERVLTERVMESKADIRARMLAVRDGLAPEQRIEMSLAMAEAAEAMSFDPGSVIAGYLPIRSEPDLRPLLARCERVAPGFACRWCWTGRQLFSGPLSARRIGGHRVWHIGARPEAEVLDPDLLLMPLSAFDARGNRLGYGAGHYDRAIARLSAKGKSPRADRRRLLLQEAEALPAEPIMMWRLEMILTEQGLRSFSQAL